MPVDDVETEVSTPLFEPTSTSVFRLTVAEGPHRGAVFAIDAASPRVLIGQSEVCGVRLADDREVSRRHAALEPHGSALRVIDLGSTNGTFVGALRITDAMLIGGERLRVGATVLQVEADTAAPALLPKTPSFGAVVGYSSAMRRLYPLCEKLAKANVPTVIEGETGTGKEILAESLHAASPRASGPFIVFDCTAVPPALVESELFGHEKGAFTGAVSSRKGVFEQAHGGTLFIDEIGDLDLHMQPKLLRALERYEVRRVGGDRWIKVDVRLLAATRRDLDREVSAGRFRDDLFHRLAVGRIELPPLRERKGDVDILAHYFCREMGGTDASLSSETLRRWEDYGWPGNVRELRNAVARLLALGDVATPAHGAPETSLPAANVDGDVIASILASGLPFTLARDRVVEEFERRFVERLLEQHGDVAKAAAASGVGKRYFQKIRARARRHVVE